MRSMSERAVTKRDRTGVLGGTHGDGRPWLSIVSDTDVEGSNLNHQYRGCIW